MNIAIPKLWAVLIIVAATYLIILVVFYFSQDKFVYFPQKYIYAKPDNLGLRYEDLTLVTQDKIKISGWYVPSKNSKGTVLFCHGNAGNISICLDTILTLNSINLDVLIFDYRGFGLSEGTPSEAGTYLDAEACWEYLVNVKKLPANKIVVFGRSLGGSVASWLAAKHEPSSLIVESSFSSIKDIGFDLYPFLPVRYLSKYNYDTSENVKKVKCPVLVVHSREDEMIPFKHAQKIYSSITGTKEFLEIAGSHNEGFAVSAQKYDKGIRDFIFKYLGEKQ